MDGIAPSPYSVQKASVERVQDTFVWTTPTDLLTRHGCVAGRRPLYVDRFIRANERSHTTRACAGTQCL
jgi:hypothetical protein